MGGGREEGRIWEAEGRVGAKAQSLEKMDAFQAPGIRGGRVRRLEIGTAAWNLRCHSKSSVIKKDMVMTKW